MMRRHAPERIVALVLLSSVGSFAADTRLEENFEDDLSRRQVVGGESIRIVDSGDAEHGRVLELRPDEVVYALVKGSEDWGSVRVEADFLFPDDSHSYLGFIYNYSSDGGRTDFGSVYIKGNGSYLRVNPRRDGNVSRLLYEEYRTRLDGDDAIVPGRWQRMMAEVVEGACHFYVGDMTTPKLTFNLYERTSGQVGFEPRVVGGAVRIDNVRVTVIEGFRYTGPKIPEISYVPKELLTDWEVLGPFRRPVRQVEREPSVSAVTHEGRRVAWRPFEVDARGAVITGRVTEYFGGRPVAYFRTVVRSETRREAALHFSTVDEIGMFLNGVFDGFVYRDGYMSGENDWNAWHDFWKKPEHAGRRIPIRLEQGDNVVVLRVRNGQFASGGFFVRLEEP